MSLRLSRMFKIVLFLSVISIGGIVHADLRFDTGSKSEEEANVLWQDSRKHKDEGKWKEAAAGLERFIARYPAAPGFTEAHGILGETYLLLNRPSNALKPLQFALEAHAQNSAPRAMLQLLRTEGLLMLKRWHEALLSANEVLQKAPKNPELHARASLLKAEALIGLKEKTRAQHALDSARGEFAAGITPELRQLDSLVDLELKLYDCALLPSKGSLSEDQTRDQMNRRGLCLLEGLQKYLKLFNQKSSETRVLAKATDRLTTAFELHRSKCKNPPPPLPLVTDEGPGKRTTVQVKRYRAELAFALAKECRENFRQANEALASIEASSLSDVQKKLRDKALENATFPPVKGKR